MFSCRCQDKRQHHLIFDTDTHMQDPSPWSGALRPFSRQNHPCLTTACSFQPRLRCSLADVLFRSFDYRRHCVNIHISPHHPPIPPKLSCSCKLSAQKPLLVPIFLFAQAQRHIQSTNHPHHRLLRTRSMRYAQRSNLMDMDIAFAFFMSCVMFQSAAAAEAAEG